MNSMFQTLVMAYGKNSGIKMFYWSSNLLNQHKQKYNLRLKGKAEKISKITKLNGI